MSLKGYIMIFKHIITLPSAALSYGVLKRANLSNENQQLARATITGLSLGNIESWCFRLWMQQICLWYIMAK